MGAGIWAQGARLYRLKHGRAHIAASRPGAWSMEHGTNAVLAVFLNIITDGKWTNDLGIGDWRLAMASIGGNTDGATTTDVTLWGRVHAIAGTRPRGRMDSAYAHES